LSPADDFAAHHLAQVVACSDDAIITKDLNGIITSWNPAAERIFGYSAAEAVGKSVRMLIPDDLQAEEDTVLAKIRAGEKVEHYQTTRRRKDGTLVSISLTVSPIRNASGVIIGASKIARDISEVVQLANAATENTRITARISDVGAELASTLDRERIVQKVTDAATELTRAEFGAFFYNVRDRDTGNAYMLYALSGAPLEAFSSFPHPRATAIFAPTFAGERVVRLDDVTKDPNYGRSAPYHGMPPGHLPVRSYLAVPVKGVRGEVLGGLFFGHSQTGVFTESHERLAVGIASWASVALENAHLYREAQDANRLKDEFLAVLSHELRTPLNSIVGYARLLRSHMLPADEVERAIETIERNSRSLTQIVNDVLDVSRIVSGKIRLNVQAVDLAAVIDSAVAAVRPAADAKGVRLHTIIDPRSGPISGDADRLEQVVWNLLTNAVKFSAKGGRVEIRLERVNSHIELTVSDAGSGITPDFLPLVFERFRQGDSGPTRASGGLGLGLAIVRHIVEMHGGTIEAASEGANRGAAFTVRLPLMAVRTGEAHSTPAPSPPSAPSSELPSLKGVRVLAVDDEADALRLLRDILKMAGAEVFTATSASVAFDLAEQHRPDVLIADIGMPGVDGYELIKRVRASSRPGVRAIPAAALTAFARSEERTKSLQSGFDIHLAKPVDPLELVASLRSLLRRHQQSS
jgi:PAS domain S-box-containing protein